MFFVLSKLLDTFVDPLTALSCSFLGVLLIRHRRWARHALVGLLIAAYGLSAPVTTLRLLHWLEGTRPALATLQPHYDMVIVLTGMTNLPASTSEQLEFLGSVDRILAGIALIKTGRADKLLISGGSSSLTKMDEREAPRLKTFALQQGLTEEQIVLEAESRNTYENAANTASLLRQTPQVRLLLITSAAHMPRSAKVFYKQGLRPDLYPVDFTTIPHMPWPLWSFLPSSTGLNASATVLHELVGLVMYHAQGYL